MCLVLWCPAGLRLARQDPLYEAIFTCTGNPVRTVGTQVSSPFHTYIVNVLVKLN